MASRTSTRSRKSEYEYIYSTVVISCSLQAARRRHQSTINVNSGTAPPLTGRGAARPAQRGVYWRERELELPNEVYLLHGPDPRVASRRTR